ncbi:hypothetical protein ADM96_15670 [Burkholderia sp. ST111]|nr:hypothetical protein ADM96_15670 [Burkholderia sp. ST111]
MTDASEAFVLKQLGWTQRELARRLGVTPQTVSGWITRPDTVPRYASEYLRVCWLAHEILNNKE